MFTKRLLAGLLAVLLCFAFVACTDTTPDTSDSKSTSDTSESKTSVTDTSATETTGTSSTETSETGTSSSETTGSETTGSDTSATETSGSQTTETPVVPPTVNPVDVVEDLETITVGKYVTLRYNANAVDVTATAEKGVGSRENVTITVTPKNGYIFDGFSTSNAIVNGSSVVSTSTTYSFAATKAVTVFANSSFALTYHANGGQFKNGFNGTDTFSAVFYLNPVTLQDNGSFARDGYTLIGYNTKADGTGEYVTLGGRVNAYGNGALDLYCVWAENTADSDFTVIADGTGVAITQYNGSAETVTIPEQIGGKTVVKIKSGAFLNNANVKKIIVPKTVKTIEKNAFNACSALESLVIWDASYSGTWSGATLSDDCLKNCTAFKSIFINTIYTLNSDWTSCGASKFDRLMWAKDKKKIIIVGGSGSLYGYDCAVIDAALGGEYEIVNLGENANITSILYFDIIEEFITEGDIVLWCPEPGSWTLGSSNCSNRFWNFRKADYSFMQYLNLSYYDNFFSSFATNCTTLASSTFKDFDKLSADVSKYGDVLSNRDSGLNHYDYNFNYSLSEKATLTELFGNITAKGGKIFFSFAAMENTSSLDEYEISNYEDMILELPGVVSISDYENCIYDYTYFWDSAWHLTDEGATLRSQHVAEDLLKALGKNN